MKKIKLTKLGKKLTEEELNQLMGGDDTYNTNTVGGCKCNYNDLSSTYNSNEVPGCSCLCGH